MDIPSWFLEVSMCANTFGSIFLCINLRVEYSREKWLKTAMFILDNAAMLAEMFAGFPRQISKEDYSHAQQGNINAKLKKN